MSSLLVGVVLFALWFFLRKHPLKWSHHPPLIRQEQRKWIEHTMNTLIAIYGKTRFLKATMIPPDDAGFPHPYSHSEHFATQVFEKLCTLIGIDHEYIELEFGETAELLNEYGPYEFETGSPHIAGSYTPDYDQSVRLNLDSIHGFDQLVTVIAHELSHVSLDRMVLEEIDHSQEDYEATTDTVSIFLGFGLFMARVNSQGRALGYLSLPSLCYALAFIAWKRHEDISTWTPYLNKTTISLITRYLTTIHETHSGKYQKQRERGVQAMDTSPTPPHVEDILHQAMTQNLSISSQQNVPQIEHLWEEVKARTHKITNNKTQNTAKKDGTSTCFE